MPAQTKSQKKDTMPALEIRVAKGAIKGAAKLELLRPTEVIIRPGQGLHLLYDFTLDEVSPKKEEYIFTIRSEIVHQRNEVPPVRVQPLTARWGDRWGLPDKADGTLKHDYWLDREGSYMCNYEVEAEYILLDWGGKKVEKRDRKMLKGSIPVQVVVPKPA